MRWQSSRRSDNIEDRRGRMVPRGPAIGGGAAIIIILIGLLLGADPAALLQTLEGTGVDHSMSSPTDQYSSPADDQSADFVAAVLGETEDVWQDVFGRNGSHYDPPHLVLFSGRVESTCGLASAASGPFYCPGDRRVYLDMSFFRDLDHRFGAPGDFAQAYVIAHEVGHHVQNLLGTMDRVHALRSRLTEQEYNQLSVRLELQADFYAGVWAHHAQRARQILESGDIEEALNAATAIGDDRLQRQSQGYVVPDAFTHGTSAQRTRWFRKGFESGDIRQGDTFGADVL